MRDTPEQRGTRAIKRISIHAWNWIISRSKNIRTPCPRHERPPNSIWSSPEADPLASGSPEQTATWAIDPNVMRADDNFDLVEVANVSLRDRKLGQQEPDEP